jgi:hypothetical protein
MFEYRLTKIKSLMVRGEYSFLCNAISNDLQYHVGGADLYFVTRQLRDQLFELFPAEMKRRPVICSSCLDTWVSMENAEKFFGYVDGRRSDHHITYRYQHNARLAFLDHLIEKYGDVQLTFRP